MYIYDKCIGIVGYYFTPSFGHRSKPMLKNVLQRNTNKSDLIFHHKIRLIGTSDSQRKKQGLEVCLAAKSLFRLFLRTMAVSLSMLD